MRKEIAKVMEKLGEQLPKAERTITVPSPEPVESSELSFNRAVSTSSTIIIPKEFKILKDFAFAELAFNTEGIRCIIEPYLLPAVSHTTIGGKTFTGSITVNKVRMIGAISYLLGIFGIQSAGGGKPTNISSISCTGSVNVDQIISVTTFPYPNPNLLNMNGTATIRDSAETGPNDETIITIDVNFEFPECVMPHTINLGVDPSTITLNETANIFGQVLDESGEPLSGIQVNLSVEPEIGGISNNNVVTDFEGEFFATFTPSSLGTSTVKATVAGANIFATQTIAVTIRNK